MSGPMISPSVGWQMGDAQNLSILDEFTRECPAILVGTSILVEDVMALLSVVIAGRSTPAFLHAAQLRLVQNNISPTFIPPGQPWKNGFTESFHDKFRDEFLQRKWFHSLLEAKVVIENWRLHYNCECPHSSLAT